MLTAQGPSVFSQTLAFDESDVLNENKSYLISALDLLGLDVKFTDEADVKVQEECCPAEPFIVFREEQPMTIKLINPQPYSPYFELELPVSDGDTVSNLINRICKETSGVKGTTN